MIELVKNKKHMIIKRDGRKEVFNEFKLRRVLMWACNNKEVYVNSIMDSLFIKISDMMKIERLYDEVINTAVNKINPLYTIYDDIAKRLLVLKLYKETSNLKKTGSYPHLISFLKDGIKEGIYDKGVIDTFTEEELNRINSFIIPDRDFLFTYKGLLIFNTKYCKGTPKRKIELPQITYIVASMYSFFNEKNSEEKLELIKKTYDMISTFRVTLATPRMTNSMTTNPQLASCILNTPDDDTWSLNRTDNNMAFYSKFSGGIAEDISYIRGSGAPVKGNSGRSDGPVPFIKRTEQTISSFNQGGCVHEKSYVEVLYSIQAKLSNDYTQTIRLSKEKFDKNKLVKVDNVKELSLKTKRSLIQIILEKDSLGVWSNEKIDINDYLVMLVPINHIQVGDYVKTMNEKSGIIEYKIVEQVHRFKINFDKQYELIFDKGSKITTSDHHPIYYRDKNKKIKHKRTDEMMVNDNGINSNNKSIKLIDINRPKLSKNFSDLSIKDNNNYFAKSFDSNGDCILVHNTRKGSCVITFPWWHWDSQDLIMLKDAGGTEDTRARKLQYAIRMSNMMIDRIDNDEEFTLFDPIDVPLLNETYGEEFDKAYIMYEQKIGIRKKKVKAKDLLFKILKVRQETGNLYLTFIDNINEQNVLNRFVGASNLCQEITIPSFPSKLIKEELISKEDGKTYIHTEMESGEIGICNLQSINLVEWYNLKEEDKLDFCYTLLRGADNVLDYQYYPAKEGEISNKRNRPIGVGVLNYANLLASKKIKYTDEVSLQFTNDLFEDLYLNIYRASVKLAKERGPFATFYQTKWKEGKTPYNLSMIKDNPLNIEYKREKEWEQLSEDIKTFGVRFSLHAAVAPTSCNLAENEIILSNNVVKSYKDIIEENTSITDMDDFLKDNPQPQWIEFKEPIEISTRFGIKKSNRVWYNGYQKIRKITFEDGKTYGFTLNHPLLTKDGWKKVKDLTENDEIVDINMNEDIHEIK